MSLRDIVNVQISKSTRGVTQVGFGIPLVLGGTGSQMSPDIVRKYGSITDVAADFATSDAEYKAANAIFSQSPRPQYIKIGHRTAEIAQVVTVTPNVATQAIQHYIETINGIIFDFTSDATPTASEVVAGLTALINAAVGLGVTASGSSTLILTAAVAGVGFSHAESANLVAVTTTPNNGAQEDLSAIQLVDNDWYMIACTSRASHDILNIAAWTEAQLKMYLACTNDSNSLVSSSTTDALFILNARKYARTAGLWSGDQANFPEAGWMGGVLPLDPGSETWAFKGIAGIIADKLTPSQIQQLKLRSANYYINVAGIDVTLDGVVSDKEYIDSIRFIDWFQQRLEERIFTDLANVPKIPYTDGGASFVENNIRAQISAGQAVGGIANDPAPTVSVPPVLSQTQADRAARRYPGSTFSWRLAGAMQEIDINGNVSV